MRRTVPILGTIASAVLCACGCGCNLMFPYTLDNPVTDPKKWEHYDVTACDYRIRFDFPPACHPRSDGQINRGKTVLTPEWKYIAPNLDAATSERLAQDWINSAQLASNHHIVLNNAYDFYKKNINYNTTNLAFLLIRHDDLCDINEWESFVAKNRNRFLHCRYRSVSCSEIQIQPVSRLNWHAVKTIRVKCKDVDNVTDSYSLSYMFCLSRQYSLVLFLGVREPHNRLLAAEERIKLWEDIANTLTVVPISEVAADIKTTETPQPPKEPLRAPNRYIQELWDLYALRDAGKISTEEYKARQEAWDKKYANDPKVWGSDTGYHYVPPKK